MAYFVIATPAWDPASAGVRALHLLCHEINNRGYPAFVLPTVRNPDLNTPLFTPDRLRKLVPDEKEPMIAVYPEGTHGNPLGATTVVRWLLNRMEHEYVGKDDLFFAWEKDYWVPGRENHRLWLPVVDESIFFAANGTERRGRCLYARKYRSNGFTIPDELLQGSKDLSGVPAGDWEMMANIFRESEYLMCFEPSSVSIEAAYCGCPTVYVTSEYMPHIPGAQNLHHVAGCTDSFDVGWILKAKNSVADRVLNHKRRVARWTGLLDNFIEICVKKAKQ